MNLTKIKKIIFFVLILNIFNISSIFHTSYVVRADESNPLLVPYYSEIMKTIYKVVKLEDFSVKTSELPETLKLSFLNIANTLYGLSEDPLKPTKSIDFEQKFLELIRNVRTVVNDPNYAKYVDDANAAQGIKDALSLVQKIAYTIFTQVDLRSINKELIDKLSTQNSNKTYKDFAKNIEKVATLAKANPFKKSEKSIYGFFNWVNDIIDNETTSGNLDPMMKGNLCSQKMLLHLKGSLIDCDTKPALCVRFGSPTIGSDKDAKISPEFFAYLDYLKNHGQKHTYINFQYNGPQGSLKEFFGAGLEYFRTNILEGLANNSRYKDTLQLISLDKNSEFYWQTGEFYGVPLVDKDKFSKIILENMFGDEKTQESEDGFFFPKSLSDRSGEFYKWASTTIPILIKLAGGSKKSYLIPKDRRTLIEIIYAMIAAKLTVSSDVINLSCKEDVDRGASSKAFLFHLRNTLDSIDNKSLECEGVERGKYLNTLMFSDAYTIRNRVVKKERLERFVEADEVLMDFVQDKEFRKFLEDNFQIKKISIK
ncbi:MAG: hypothetical protein HQK49_17425 [Oligoflexia bacterium]|nr:hypothetical protein [Oligoflexia bacterium]